MPSRDEIKIRKIVDFLDDPAYRLKDCYYYPRSYGYDSRRSFLLDLKDKAAEILSTKPSKWNQINIARCIEIYCKVYLTGKVLIYLGDFG